MSYRRKHGNRGKKCIRRKRVRVRGHGMALRCVKYGSKRRASRSSKRRGKRRCVKYAGRSRGGYRKGHRPANKGKRCVSWGRNRLGRRTCRSYGGKSRSTRRLPASNLVNEQRTYENRMRRAMYEEPSIPSWWAT